MEIYYANVEFPHAPNITRGLNLQIQRNLAQENRKSQNIKLDFVTFCVFWIKGQTVYAADVKYIYSWVFSSYPNPHVKCFL